MPRFIYNERMRKPDARSSATVRLLKFGVNNTEFFKNALKKEAIIPFSLLFSNNMRLDIQVGAKQFLNVNKMEA